MALAGLFVSTGGLDCGRHGNSVSAVSRWQAVWPGLAPGCAFAESEPEPEPEPEAGSGSVTPSPAAPEITDEAATELRRRQRIERLRAELQRVRREVAQQTGAGVKDTGELMGRLEDLERQVHAAGFPEAEALGLDHGPCNAPSRGDADESNAAGDSPGK